MKEETFKTTLDAAVVVCGRIQKMVTVGLRPVSIKQGNAVTASSFYFMSRALALAEHGRGTVSPNPMVGCVIVKNDRMISEAWHQKAGEPHAEILALQQCSENLSDASLYVTLEPCCHQGRTPPCVNALIASGIKKIYVACLDPNPQVAGKGVVTLQEAGIEVEVGLLEKEARALNKIFFHYITQCRPYIIAKWAMSLDGKTIAPHQDQKQISSLISQQHLHEMRQTVAAILIGSNTARLDNPLLTVRLCDNVKRQPLRIILASKGNIPLDLSIFSENLPGKTIIVTTQYVDSVWLKAAKNKNIQVWEIPANQARQVDLKIFMERLAQHEITSLLVEGGETVHASFFKENLVDEIQVYLAPKIMSQFKQKLSLKNFTYEAIGDDLFLHATTVYLNN